MDTIDELQPGMGYLWQPEANPFRSLRTWQPAQQPVDVAHSDGDEDEGEGEEGEEEEGDGKGGGGGGKGVASAAAACGSQLKRCLLEDARAGGDVCDDHTSCGDEEDEEEDVPDCVSVRSGQSEGSGVSCISASSESSGAEEVLACNQYWLMLAPPAAGPAAGGGE